MGYHPGETFKHKDNTRLPNNSRSKNYSKIPGHVPDNYNCFVVVLIQSSYKTKPFNCTLHANVVPGKLYTGTTSARFSETEFQLVRL